MTIKINIKRLFKDNDFGLWKIKIEIFFMQQIRKNKIRLCIET